MPEGPLNFDRFPERAVNEVPMDDRIGAQFDLNHVEAAFPEAFMGRNPPAAVRP
jgi:hypothetical protein